MPVRKSAELFGDDAANGPRVPIDTTPAAPGLGAKNRGIAYKEMLTSRSVNRITYALALNDDDLEARLAVYESGGLDTVYRQGLAGVAGAGRVINIDGGAVEARQNIAAPYAGDRANASIRARSEGATVDGAGGFDFVARAGGAADPSPGRGGWGFLDRRAVVFNGPRTRLAFTQNGVLNVNGAGKTTISVSGADYFSASSQTDLLVGVDLLEVFDGVHAGLYVITDASTAQRAVLLRFDGTAPNFGPNVAVTFRVYRPVFTTGGGKIGAAPTFGTRFVAMPGDTDHAPAIQLLQPSTSAYLVAGINKTGGRVFSVNGVGNVEAADVFGTALRTQGGSISQGGAIAGSSLNVSGAIGGASGVITNNLSVGSLTVTSGSIGVGQSSADKYTANEFQGGVFKGASAAITGPVSVYGLAIGNYGDLTLNGGNLTLSTVLPNGGRVTARSLAVLEYVTGASMQLSGGLQAGSAHVAGGVIAGALTVSGSSGGVKLPADVEIGTLPADPGYPGFLRVQNGIRSTGVVAAPQFSIVPSEENFGVFIPMLLWKPMAGYAGYLDETLSARYYALSPSGDGGQILMIPITGIIPFGHRIMKISIWCSRASNVNLPRARLMRHSNPVAGMTSSGGLPRVLDATNAPPLTLNPPQNSTITEISWSWTWQTSATIMPHRRTDGALEVWIQSTPGPLTSGLFYIFGVSVDYYRVTA